MHERKARLTELADGFVVLPGGFGTVDEFAEVLTWNQLGLIAKPVVLLDVDGYWAPMFEWMCNVGRRPGFVRDSHRMLAQRGAHRRRGDRPRHGAGAGVGHKWIDRDFTPMPGVPRSPSS